MNSQTFNSEEFDDLRPEYDFSQMQIVARGPGRKQPHPVIVELAPDAAEMFPNAAAVNEALRFLIKVTTKSAPIS